MNIIHIIKKNKLQIMKISIVLFISVLFSMIVSTAKTAGLNNVIKDKIKISFLSKEQLFITKDFALSGYSVNGDLLTTISDDPMMTLSKELNSKVYTLTINFLEPIENDLDLQVYYTNGGEAFNENQVLVSNILEGETSKTIKLNQYVKNIRIDIGTSTGLKFKINNIVFNNKNSIKAKDIIKNFLNTYLQTAFNGIWLERFKICLILFAFCGLHFAFPIKEMYTFLFNRRWSIALFLLLFLVVNKYNGDSMTLYNSAFHIQEGQGSDYIEPVFGVPRPIRSDEYIVSNPNKLSAQFGSNAYSKYNNVIRGTKTLNSVSGVYKGYSTLGKNPFLFAYFLMDAEHAFSLNWYAPIILLFMVTIELFLIFSKGKKLVSVTGAFLITFSSFYMWWGFPIYFLAAHAAIVCAYYFLNLDNKLLKLLCGLGVSISASVFITNLYPAWQVPLGYVVLAFLIWLIHDNWEKIKNLDKKDWLIFGLSLLFLFSLVGTYLFNISEYTKIISNTVYPGKRMVSGGNALNKIFYYFQSILYPYKDIGNPSEAGVFFSLFPVPTIAVIFCWIKDKKKDWLTGGLLVVTSMLLLYSTVGLPSTCARMLLLTYSIPERVIDIIGYIQICFIVFIFSRFKNEKKLSPIISVIIALFTSITSMTISTKYFPNYASRLYSVFAIIIIAFICYCMLTAVSKRLQNVMLVSLICISLLTGVTVRPIVKGLDSIYSKPVGNKIIEIMEKDNNAKWLTYGDGRALQGFAVACGAPTINSVNTYPNLELWNELDESKKYEDIYNRYAHILLDFTNDKTSFELVWADAFTLKLSYNDIYKTKAKYILSMEKLEEDASANVKFELIYDEYNCYIYEIRYF